MSNPFNIGVAYNFKTLAPAVLGLNMEELTVMAIMEYEVANTFRALGPVHAVVYPLLPPGTIDDATQLTYVVFKTKPDIDGASEKIVLALQWIDLPTVEVVTGDTLVVTINGANVGDDVAVRDILRLAGFLDFVIVKN